MSVKKAEEILRCYLLLTSKSKQSFAVITKQKSWIILWVFSLKNSRFGTKTHRVSQNLNWKKNT